MSAISARNVRKSQRKVKMLWNEILAMQENLQELKRTLSGCVGEIMDHLVQKEKIVHIPMDSSEYLSIMHRGSWTDHEKIEEMLHQLIVKSRQDEMVHQLIVKSRQDEDDDDRTGNSHTSHSAVFRTFCDILLTTKVNCPALEGRLREDACRLKANGRREDAASCSLRLPHLAREKLKNGQASDYLAKEAKRRDCIEKFMRHQAEVCREDGRRLNTARCSVSDAFVAVDVQIANERRILGLTASWSVPATHNHMDSGGESLCLTVEKASQLLGIAADSVPHTAGKVWDLLQALKVMVVGNPGQGKTFLSKSLLNEFVSSRDHGNKSSLACLYDCVIPISCRETERMKSNDWHVFLGLDHPALQFSDMEKTWVCEHLIDKASRVLVVFDGLDEVDVEWFSEAVTTQGNGSAAINFLYSAKRKNKLLGASVFVTSRPCSQAYSLVKDCNRYFNLSGFSEESFRHYCYSQLGDAAGSRCLEQLNDLRYRQLGKVTRSTPLFASLLCHYYSTRHSVPNSATDIYHHYLISVIASLQDRGFVCDPTVQVFKTVPNPCLGKDAYDLLPGQHYSVLDIVDHHLEHAVLMRGQFNAATSCVADGDDNCAIDGYSIVAALDDVYQLALDALLNHRHSFAASALSNQSLLICKTLGVLVPCVASRVSSPQHQVSFAHLTFQDWCAARAASQAEDMLATVRQCIELLDTGPSAQLFWQFLLSSQRCDSLMATILALREHNQTKRNLFDRKSFLTFLLLCLSERLRVTQHGCTACCREFEQAAGVLVRDGINLAGIYLEDCHIKALASLVQVVGRSDHLVLEGCSLTAPQSLLLVPSLPFVTRVDLSGSAISGEVFAGLARNLRAKRQACNLKSLNVTRCQLTGLPDSSSELVAFMVISKIESLDLKESPVFGTQFLRQCKSSLAVSSSMTLLNLGYCGLSLEEGCGRLLSFIATCFPSLEQLRLTGNKLTNSNVVGLLTSMSFHKRIQQLHLQDNLLDDGIAYDLVEFFQRRDAARQPGSEVVLAPCDVVLTGNKTSKNVLKQIATSGFCGNDRLFGDGAYVADNTVYLQCIRATVSKCKGLLNGLLVDELMAPLATCLLASNITVLDLTTCQIADTGARALAGGFLKQTTTLSVLVLYNNLLTMVGAMAVLDALATERPVSTASKISALVLSRNDLFSMGTDVDCYCQFLMAIKLLRSLCFLSLENTGMPDHVGFDLLSHALKYHPRISFLNIACNVISDRTVSALCSLAGNGSCLTHIGLINNPITCEGEAELVASHAVKAMVYVGMSFKSSKACHLSRPFTNDFRHYSVETLVDIAREYGDAEEGR